MDFRLPFRCFAPEEVRELISKHMMQANNSSACTEKSMLGDVCGWLVLNSMLSDRLQFNVLQTQNLSNIWRTWA